MIAAALIVALAGCGGSEPPPPAGTLAYVLTECRDTRTGFAEHQALRIRHSDRPGVTVLDLADVGPQPGLGGLCRFLSRLRFGDNSVERGAFTRLTISPDGATIVFEVTDAFTSTFPSFLAPEQQGLFRVRADGSGLQRLGPPSREAPFTPNLSALLTGISFSRDNRILHAELPGPQVPHQF